MTVSQAGHALTPHPITINQIETYQWKKIENGEIDIVFGKKGTGKSAIYSLIRAKEDDFFDKNILIKAAENPQGDAAAAPLGSAVTIPFALVCRRTRGPRCP